jgi:formamidopyrimidine-DNA glycosylase (fpg)
MNMPELPEVETIRLTLLPKLVGRTIVKAQVHLAKLVQNQTIDAFSAQIYQQKINVLDRRGKYLLFNFEGGLVLAIHLRMTGQLIVEPAGTPPAKATYMQLTLDDGNELRFRDQRKFGRVMLFNAKNPPAALEKLGPEPLSADFTIQCLKTQLLRRRTAIKKALLDQEIIAGIGNIYADEALFLAGIHPARLVASLSQEEIEKLYQAIRQVLSEGIQNRGTTKRDYRDGNGHAGANQEQLRVYDRKGLACIQCGNMIVKMNFGGRGTHFCPICQK